MLSLAGEGAAGHAGAGNAAGVSRMSPSCQAWQSEGSNGARQRRSGSRPRRRAPRGECVESGVKPFGEMTRLH